MHFATQSIFLYLLMQKNIGSKASIVLAFIFALNIADKDAKNNMIVKPRCNIVLKKSLRSTDLNIRQ